MSKELKGIGGWLLVLVILLILGVLNDFSRVISNFSESIISSTVYLILGVFGVIVLIFIFNKSQKAPMITLVYLWISFVIGAIMMLFTVFLFDLGLEGAPQEYVGIAQNFLLVISALGIFLELIITIIFTLYLIKSVRVKNTFS